ncbi:MAG: hypothetical protein N3D11_00405 [Candidatus Sumerlaeia bacterium]|nr:hypothetical protein [Candidatus Sumerlaeia bacterium]
MNRLPHTSFGVGGIIASAALLACFLAPRAMAAPDTTAAASPAKTTATVAATSPTPAAVTAASTARTTATPPPPLFSSGEGKSYVVVSVDGGMLSQHGTVVLKRGIDFARSRKASLVVLRIQTPGGLVSVMLGMRDALIECPLPTLSFVNKAYSAGSLLALATDRIYMHPMGHIGDAIPIQLGLGGAQEMQGDLKEKILAPMRKEFATTARYKKHREDLAIGMVDLDYEIPGLKPKGQILVLDAPTAVREGLAVKVVETIEEAVADAGLTGATRIDYEPTRADRLASFLSSPIANMILIIVVIAAIVIEVKTPGFGVGGIVALIALFLFFWANWYANLAHWLEILLFLSGVGLMIAELSIPGFGVLGVSGLLCILASLFLAMFRFPPQGFGFTYDRIGPAVRNMAWALVLGVGALALIAEALRHSRLWQKISLGDEMEAKKGFAGVPDLSQLVGREGTVLTDLRPVGTVVVGGRRLDAVTQGEFLERGTPVKIIRIEGAQVVVEKQA